MEEKVVTNVSDFIKEIGTITNQGFTFYRGQCKNTHKLLPSLLRKNENGNDVYGINCDKNFQTHFKSRSIPYLTSIPTKDIEWLFIAQHYGLPTRLLDWTSSALVALFFAVENSQDEYDESKYPVVWCLNPIELNIRGMFLGRRIDVPNLMENNSTLDNCIETNYKVGVTLEEPIYPLALSGPVNNSRIESQRGVFTLFPVISKPLEDWEDSDGFLIEIKVHPDYVHEIKKELFNLGINNTSIYPELSSTAKDIVFEYKQ